MLERRYQTAAVPPGQTRGFFRGRRGSMLTWAALMMVPLLGFVGIGVDTARGYLVRARLAQSLDAAALAAGRQTSDTTKAEDAAKMVFKANFPPGYMDATLTGPTVTFNASQDTVTATGSAVVPTYFMHLIGQNTITVSGNSEVTRKTVFMDVVISIDVSGSMNGYMGGKKKIDSAKSASTILVDTLFGSSDTKDLLKMGLVMWSANVRILPIDGEGSNYNDNQTTSKTVPSFKNPYTGSNQTTLYFPKNVPVPLFTKPSSSWKGCTEARFFDDGKTNDADLYVDTPTLGSGSSMKEWKGWQRAHKNDDDNTMQCPNHGIRRLTNIKGKMTAALTKVKDPTGNTNLAMGLMWAWKVLGVPGSGSPYVGDGTPEPGPGEGQMVRAIVIMTDGANTSSSTDAYQGQLSSSEINQRSKDAAKKIKEAGIVIYTIRFGNEASESLLKEVASGPTAPYYQYAPSADALQDAFKEIGNHLSKLRISK